MSSAIYNQLTSKITSEFYKQLIFKIKILAEERDFICEKVEVARARLETPTNEVVYWLRQADEFLASAETFMGTLEHNNTWWGMRRSKLRKQGYQLLNCADELTKKAELFDYVSWIDRPVNVPQVLDSEILGMEDSLKELQECINNKEVGTIGICGVGGSGKTTLLQVIFNRSDIVENFDIAIFIHVSADPNVKDLQKQILMRLQIREQQNENQFTQAASIQRMLTGRKYLLALDDVWQRLDLETIGIPYPNSENGCKVIFTTRMEGICVEMKAHKITLKPLSQEHAWDLFCRSAGLAGSVIVSQPEISAIIRQIIEKCNSSPLALIVIGRQLASRTLTSLAEVRDLLHEINNSLRMDNSVPDDDKFSPILQTVELSYEHLDNQLLKDCFLYCSLFPEGYSITTEELISYWIAEGFFDTMVDLASTYDIHRKAHDLIRQLKCRSFLEEGKNPESEVIMHDLLHSFALMKMKNKFFVSVDREQTPKTLRLEEVERVSLMDSNIKSLDEFPYCPRLLTLILRRNACLKNLADRILQSHMLRVLDLSKTGIREIPSSIGSLIELGYLDLSFTKIKSLPKQLRQLVKLKYLGLEGTTKLTTVPGDVINNLSNVMVLNLYDSYGDWQVDEGPHMESRASMEELQSLTRVSDIGITICNTPSFRRFLKSPAALMSSTRKLIVRGCQDLSTFHLSSLLSNVKVLNVSDCFALKEFIIDSPIKDMEVSPLSLEVLRLEGLYETKILFAELVVPRDCLHMLRDLTIGFAHELTNLTWVSQLDRLEHLNLYCCRNMESIIEGDEIAAFHKMKTMTLRKLPSIKRICIGTLEFPCFESIKVLECPQLRNLPLAAGSAKSIRVISGEKEWWNNLDWTHDKRAILAFHKYFQAD